VRIAYISAGAAHMYCGSCLHDNTLVAALQRLGHDAVLVPTYTRLRTDEPDVSLDRVFFGALNVYLKQVAAPLRRGPALLERLLDRPWLLALVSRFGASTHPRRLGELTLSILRGEEGHQAAELDKLVAWLRDSFQPEIVHLTNSMFAGFARRLKAELGVPIVCSVQGEELFLDSLPEPSRGQARAELAVRAGDIDLFIAPNRFYAELMESYLRMERGDLAVVPLGVRLAGHGGGPPASMETNVARSEVLRPGGGCRGEGASPSLPKGWEGDRGDAGLMARDRRQAVGGKTGRPWVIGYLARIAPEKGLHLLAAAFRGVAAALGPGRVRLQVAGYLPPQHRHYLRGIERQLAGWGLGGDFRYLGEVTRDEKLRFLGGLDVLAAPSVYPEPKGLYVLEALASGVPVVAPRHGAFPELLEETGGGVLVAPGDAAELAAALGELLQDPERRERLGRAGREAVHARYSDTTMAAATLKLYERCLDARPAAAAGRRRA
jgi:glycosyltransferase involved in cell wall biosynthesis